MSGICEIFPEDPSCAVEEPVVEEPVVEEEAADGEVEEEGAEDDAEEGEGEEVDAEPEAKKDFGEAAATAVADWNRVKDMSGLAMLSPLMANLEFLAAAAMWAGSSAMMAFRYRSASTYYDSALYTGDTNYWKLGDQMRLFGGLAIGGLLAVTQLLATLGIAVGLNGTVWMLVGGLGGMILSLAVGIVRFLGYEQGYTNATETDATKVAAGIVTKGTTMMTAIKTDMIEDAACNAGMAIALAGAAEGWYYNLWNAYTDEEQSTMVAEWEETIATRAMEVAEARAAMAPAAEEEGEDAEEATEEAEEGAEEGEEGEAAEEGEEATEEVEATEE
jgi:hypothetical protein